MAAVSLAALGASFMVMVRKKCMEFACEIGVTKMDLQSHVRAHKAESISIANMFL